MILGIGGKLSGGKTVFGVAYCKEQLSKGKRIISNIRLNFKANPGQVVYMSNQDIIRNLKDFYEKPEILKNMFRDSVLFIDEIVNLLSARASGSSLNELVTNFVVLTGKINCDVVYTFQVEESQVDKILRNICNIYVECYRMGQDLQPILFKDRKIKEKIQILVVVELDFGLLGIKNAKLIFDPEPYFQDYDTEEFSLLDRSKYLRGGTRDLRR